MPTIAVIRFLGPYPMIIIRSDFARIVVFLGLNSISMAKERAELDPKDESNAESETIFGDYSQKGLKPPSLAWETRQETLKGRESPV